MLLNRFLVGYLPCTKIGRDERPAISPEILTADKNRQSVNTDSQFCGPRFDEFYVLNGSVVGLGKRGSPHQVSNPKQKPSDNMCYRMLRLWSDFL